MDICELRFSYYLSGATSGDTILIIFENSLPIFPQNLYYWDSFYFDRDLAICKDDVISGTSLDLSDFFN